MSQVVPEAECNASSAEIDTFGPKWLGPGRYISKALAGRRDRIARCLVEGEPVFEKVLLVGYDKPIVRCVRCKTLKRQHAT